MHPCPALAVLDGAATATQTENVSYRQAQEVPTLQTTVRLDPPCLWAAIVAVDPPNEQKQKTDGGDGLVVDRPHERAWMTTWLLLLLEMFCHDR